MRPSCVVLQSEKSPTRITYTLSGGDAREAAQFPTDSANGIHLRAGVEGKGSLVSLLHGFPQWLSEEDLDYYVVQYRQSGFRGTLNWYRNIDRNVELTPQLETAKIECPSFFIAGAKDLVLSFVRVWIDQVDNWVADIRGKVLWIHRAAHRVQVEQPQAVNESVRRIHGGGPASTDRRSPPPAC